jgi:LPS-assembly lipoprotein
MSWFKAFAGKTTVVRLLLLCLVAASNGCGFQPLYKKGVEDPGVTRDLSEIKVMTVKAKDRDYDRLGQQLNSLLRERLRPDGSARQVRYTLENDLSVSLARTGIQITEEATRARLTVRVAFRLLDSRTNRLLYRGTEQSINSYNVVDSQYATLSAENDAARRAIREISDSLRLRLALYFQRQRNSG